MNQTFTAAAVPSPIFTLGVDGQRTPVTSLGTGEPCKRCGSRRYVDRPIHQGQSTRRDCAVCRLTHGFPRWYGVDVEAET